jgi:hypothetical protein
MKGDKPTMNNLGSNNLVSHVHVLYLNVRPTWKKNQVWGRNMGGWPTTQVWPIDHPNTSL